MSNYQERRGDSGTIEPPKSADPTDATAARKRRRERTDGADKHQYSITKDGAGFGLGTVDVHTDADAGNADAAKKRREARLTGK